MMLETISRYYVLLLFLLLQSRHAPGREEGALPPGHMMPLGSHRPPELVTRTPRLPSPREFSQRYVTSKVPVLMEGAMNNSQAWRNWQEDRYLREHFGDVLIGVEEGKKENRSDPRYLITVEEYLNRYETEDIYMVDELPPPMYKEWQVPRPLLCPEYLEKLMYANVWFSNGGTKSVLHTDSFDNLHCLVSGRKEFILMEPKYINVIGPEHESKGYYDVDVERVDMLVYPELATIPWLKATVHAGDCLYIPYQWVHNVNSYGRNMGVNIWWLNTIDALCPLDEADTPEYMPLGEMELSPDMIVIEVLDRVAREDGSVHAEEMHEVVAKFQADQDYGTSIITLEQVQKILDILQPGCDGVISDYRHIPKQRINEAHEFITALLGDGGGDGGGDGDNWDELYDPQEEFGGYGMVEDDPSHMTEDLGGGDYEQPLKDEL